MTLNKKLVIWCILILGMTIYACSKDGIESSLQQDSEIMPRSSQALEVSYDMEKVSIIEPDDGEYKDMCIGDIKMLQELTKLYSVTATLTETHDPCIEIIRKKKVSVSGYSGNNNNSNGDGGSSFYTPGYEHELTTKYCNRILTIISRDTTISKTVTTGFEFWRQVVQGYLHTEIQIQENFEEMIDVLEQNGATVIEDAYSVSITETTATGEQITSVYNKQTNLLMYTEMKDASGEVKKNISYEYSCGPDGRIVPKTIYIRTTDTSTICKTPFTKKEWMMFHNYSVTIQ